jgi:hypothetical protein
VKAFVMRFLYRQVVYIKKYNQSNRFFNGELSMPALSSVEI